MIQYNPTVSGSLVVTGSLITTGNINGINLSTFSASINNALTESKVTHIVSQSSGVYYIDGVQKPSMTFVPGITYRFDTTIPDNPSHQHPFKFSTTQNGPIQYVDGVTSGSNYIQIETSYNTPDVLYYYCTIHNSMGNAINVLKIDKLLTTVSSSFDSRYVISGSITQTTWDNIASKPSGIVSGSVQVLGGTNIISGSSQITSLLPSGIVSGSAQTILNLPTGVVSGSAQTIANLPTGVVSSSSQITYVNIGSIPAGIVSGSSQLNNASIENLTVVNLTTVNETASVIFSSGSNRFGDFGNDIHSFTGSVQISGSQIITGSLTVSSTTIINSSMSANSSSLTLNSGSNLYVQNNGIVEITGSVQVSGSTIITGSVSATSFNGTINAINGVVSGSSQVVSILNSLNTYTGSQDTKNSTLATYTASLDAKNLTLATYTSSVDTKFTSVGISTASLNTYTSSLKTALQLTGSNVVVLGDLTVLGTTNTANSTTLNISDKFITLASGSTSSVIANGAGFRIAGANVTMSWESANSQLKFNTDISASKFYGDGTGLIFNGSGIVSSSVQTIANLPTGTVSGSSQVVSILNSLNTYTGSNDVTNSLQTTRIDQLAAATASINSFTASNSITSLNSYTASNDTKWSTLQTLTASNEASIGQINLVTASLNSKTGSYATTGSNSFIGNQIITGSLILSSSADVKLQVIGNAIITGSLILSSSALVELNVIGNAAITGSLVVSGSLATFRNVISTSYSNIQAGNDISSNGGGIALFGSGFTPSNQYRANGAYFYSNLAGGLTLHAEGINSMYLATNNTTAATISSAQVVNFANLPTVASSNMRTDANTSYSTTFSAVSSVTVTHNLGTKNVMVMCYGSDDAMFWPSSIVTTSTSVVDIVFTASRTGRVVVIR